MQPLSPTNQKLAGWGSFLRVLDRVDEVARLRTSLRERSGKGERFRILTDTVTSPSLGAQIQAVLAVFPGTLRSSIRDLRV